MPGCTIFGPLMRHLMTIPRQAPKGMIRNLLIVGNYGAKNFGDDAMLTVLVHHLRRHFRLTVFSVLHRKSVEKKFGVVSVSAFTPLRLLAEMVRADCVLIGGGSLIKNLSMLKLAPIFLAILLMKKRRVFIGVEVHKLNSLLEALFFALCRDSIAFFTRSSSINQKIGAGIRCMRMPDLAYGLAGIYESRQDTGAPNPPVVGVNVRPSTLTDRFDSKLWLTRVADLLEELAPQNILMFPFQPCDRKEIAKLVHLLRNRRLRSTIRSVNVASFEHALKYMRGLSLAIGMRLHFLIFASLLGVPFVSVPYHEKVARFADSVNAPILFTNSKRAHSLEYQLVIEQSRRVTATISLLLRLLGIPEVLHAKEALYPPLIVRR